MFVNHDWPARLRQFSLAVDVIEVDIFDDIKDALGRYFENVMGCHYFRVVVDGATHETEEGETLPALDTL